MSFASLPSSDICKTSSDYHFAFLLSVYLYEILKSDFIITPCRSFSHQFLLPHAYFINKVETILIILCYGITVLFLMLQHMHSAQKEKQMPILRYKILPQKDPRLSIQFWGFFLVLICFIYFSVCLFIFNYERCALIYDFTLIFSEKKIQMFYGTFIIYIHNNCLVTLEKSDGHHLNQEIQFNFIYYVQNT